MEEYLGFKEVTLSDEELALIYQKTPNYSLGCLENEYLVVHNKNGEIADYFRWDGSQFVQVPFKQINSRFCGKVKPRNTQQRLAIDMLQNPEITINMLGGKFGTGKTFIMATTAMDLLEKGKFEKLVYVRNNIEVKDSKPIGFIPGDKYEKLLPFAMPLADNIGGPEALKMMISQGNIETVHFGQIRGRDFKNSIIMCSEVENMTKEHIQLLIGRVGEGSVLWLDGDVKQVDMEVFRKNSGMQIALERLKGHHRFGYVKLLKTERSETAAMADLLD
jgi:predicted ribonuclease YlaK